MRGDFALETVYDDDPVAVAVGFAEAGAKWIHVVDLDAARTGTAAHLDVIRDICNSVNSHVQSGGGVRTREAAEDLLAAGVSRVVIGTAAVENPGMVAELAADHPDGVAVGLDARGREVAVKGWVEGSGYDLIDLAKAFAEQGVAALVVTEIQRDGTLEGPDLVQLLDVLSASEIPLIASGGVGRLDDLAALLGVASNGRRLSGAIVGRAIYESRFDVAEALELLAGSQ